MSIGRAVRRSGGCRAGPYRETRQGAAYPVRFQAEGSRQLFDAAHDLLRSPVRTEKFIRDAHVPPPLKHAGESALAGLTDLSPPPLTAFAVRASDWKIVAQTHRARRNRPGSSFPYRGNLVI